MKTRKNRFPKTIAFGVDLVIDLLFSVGVCYAIFAIIAGDYKAHTWDDTTIWFFASAFLCCFLGLQFQKIK